jgi:hypothetical protein
VPRSVANTSSESSYSAALGFYPDLELQHALAVATALEDRAGGATGTLAYERSQAVLYV